MKLDMNVKACSGKGQDTDLIKRGELQVEILTNQ
jgi:hypothetical protein